MFLTSACLRYGSCGRLPLLAKADRMAALCLSGVIVDTLEGAEIY